VIAFKDARQWEEDPYIIPEYFFGLN